MVSPDMAAVVTEPESLLTLPAEPGGRRRELSNWTLAVYALPSIPIAFLFLPVSLLMPAYYASTLHVSLAAVGGFLLLSRSADVILDPMIGKWSDATRSRFGRRRLWMMVGTPLLMFGAFILFMPMVPVSGWYLLVASFIIYAGGSTVGLPYSAWGTEIVHTYNGRARMAGIRETAGVIGSLVAAVVAASTGYLGHGVDRYTMSIMGWMIIVLTPLTVWIATSVVGEPPAPEPVRTPWWPSIAALFANRPFRLFCLTYVIFTVGSSVASATLVFYVSDYIGQSNMVGPGILGVSFMTVAFVPAWLWISRRIGKHRATVLSLLASMGLYAGLTPFIHHGQGWLYVGLLCVLGVVSSGFQTLPLGMIGDIIDYDTLIHGQPRGGLFWGVWSFAQKVSPAFAISATLSLLGLFGYSPGAHNTASALKALKYIYCFGPAPFYVVGASLLFWFPIDARRHDIIRRRLDARQARAER
ncbi:MAG TPA: MFS transporter [Caulobacteraceae bacterium]|jgi:Na+/melibiose symporter-like transporter|nr:MFS transporter [Caulobacteraceae bacterium]